MSIFLPKNEIEKLTGTKQLTKQIRWLNDHSYLYQIGVNGQIVMLQSHVEKKLGGEYRENITCSNKTPDIIGLKELQSNG